MQIRKTRGARLLSEYIERLTRCWDSAKTVDDAVKFINRKIRAAVNLPVGRDFEIGLDHIIDGLDSFILDWYSNLGVARSLRLSGMMSIQSWLAHISANFSRSRLDARR